MSEFRITRRAALDGRKPLSSPGISLSPLPEGHVIHVLAKADQTDGREQLAALSDGESCAVRAAGPSQWFIVGNSAKSHGELESLFESLQPAAHGVDQSAGRVRILAEGPMVERVLCKGTAVDLSIAAFPVGHSATTLIGHIAAHVTRIDKQAFEIMVLRGFAESLWDDLARMSAEFA